MVMGLPPEPISPFWKGGLGKRIAVTLDLESDYATGKVKGLDQAGHVVTFLKEHIEEFTVFCEGILLKERHPIIGLLQEAGGEIQLHCNDHRNGPDDLDALKRGLEAYEKYFKCLPEGYRAGNLRMNPQLIEYIKAAGLKWDSSYFTGRKLPSLPYRHLSGLVEFPVSRFAKRLCPCSMSYFSFMGPFLYNLLKGVPFGDCYINFYFHIHDIIPSPALELASYRRRMLHQWNYRFGLRDPFPFFVHIIQGYLLAGFIPISLGRLYRYIEMNGESPYV